ncbi:hypothetical protein GIB67_012373, partial [Kingdonia uniflora]
MSSRPEFQSPPEIYYNDTEARNLVMFLLVLCILDVAIEREVEGDLLLCDMGQVSTFVSLFIIYLNMNFIRFRSAGWRVIDGAISISAIQ